MDFVTERASNRMVPGQGLGQTGKFICVASLEQDAYTSLSQGKVPDRLQQVDENRNGHRVEHESFQRVDHLEQRG